ncbi:hypothetical protein CMsap09_06495 [Clavibacter michiganensis]|uniref:Uncharacterized protein n=1 Tax=Clavibacter michiganensis TaxID=28447 RepID=A0A251XTV4_9MICO|nr:hypothetical protein CMsap09_06495 [Clavibacter michiganensis]
MSTGRTTIRVPGGRVGSIDCVRIVSGTDPVAFGTTSSTPASATTRSRIPTLTPTPTERSSCATAPRVRVPASG